MIDRAAGVLDAGGPIADLLVVLSVAMWTVVVLRWQTLRAVGRALSTQVRGLHEARALLDRCEHYAALLRSLVSAAPLLGLLGTVSGMVETFASLRSKGGVALTHATEQTVAGGISVALITTQLGLVVGIGGLVVARALQRLERRRRIEVMDALTRLRARMGATR